MENKLDKLFRAKLEQHSIAPSANAWEKVAAGFPKKNNTWTLSWRIAAAVALLAMVSWLAYDFSREEKVEITKDSTIETPKQNAVAKDKEAVEKPVVEKETSAPVQRMVADRAPKTTTTPQLITNTYEKETWKPEIQPVQDIRTASVEEVTEPVVIVEPTTTPKKSKAIVIVFNLAPVEKQDVETAKINTFKKVIDFAKDVKSGETTLASVRNWKDNLLGSEEEVRVEKQNND